MFIHRKSIPLVVLPVTSLVFPLKREHTSDIVEVYLAKARELIGSFLDQQITLDECLAELDYALDAIDPRPTGVDLDRLTSQVHWERRIVLEAAAKRNKPRN